MSPLSPYTEPREHRRNNWSRTVLLGLLLALPSAACGGADDDPGTADGGGGASESTSSSGGGGAGGDESSGCRELSGVVSEPETLRGCVVVVEDVRVQADLSVDPGTTITFEPRTVLRVEQDGSLYAVGTEQDPIRFTGSEPEPGHYIGLVFDGSYSMDNQLEHVIVEHAGFAPNSDYVNAAVRVEGDPVRVSIQRSTIRDNDSYGLTLWPDAELGDFADNVFENNAYSVQIPLSVVGSLDAGTVYGSAEDDYVRVYGAELHGTQTWRKLDVPYRVRGKLVVEGDLSIEPGVEIIASQETYIRVRPGGTLSAVGTAEEPILFTADEPLPGFWTGVWYDSTTSVKNELEYVIVEYAGGHHSNLPSVNITGTLNPGNVTLSAGDGNCQVRIANSTIRFSRQWGIMVFGETIFGGTATLTGDRDSMEFEGNETGDVGGLKDYIIEW